MNLLITGGAGFIGSHLCENILKTGHKVIVLDNLDPFYDPQIKRDNLKKLIVNDNFVFIEEDIRNESNLIQILNNYKIEMVVHLAAKAGVRPSISNPREYISTNIDGLVSVMEAMRKTNVKKLVFASSSSIYGNDSIVPFVEDQHINSTYSPYAASKLAGEVFATNYANIFGIRVAMLRLFTVYGPRQRPDLAIHKFIKANLSQSEITIYGDGNMSRDYTYVTDIVSGFVSAIDWLNKSTFNYDIFNLGNSKPITINELCDEIEQVTTLKFKRKYVEKPLGDVKITYADISKSREVLKYNPQVSLKNGILNFVEWFKENPELMKFE